jgi:hypothetical protein
MNGNKRRGPVGSSRRRVMEQSGFDLVSEIVFTDRQFL